MNRLHNLLLVCLLGLSVSVTSAKACGWAGDGDDKDFDAVVVTPQKPKINTSPTVSETADIARQSAKAMRTLLSVSQHELRQQAIETITKAALLGYAPAQNNLATLYETGNGFEQNNEKAALWFKKAAEQSEPHAEHSLAMMYYEGRGVPRDRAKARDLLERSALHGHASACRDIKKLRGLKTCPVKP